MNTNFGYNPVMSEQLLYSHILTNKSKNEKIIVHHVSKNTPSILQLEVERRSKSGITFERIVINHDTYKLKSSLFSKFIRMFA